VSSHADVLGGVFGHPPFADAQGEKIFLHWALPSGGVKKSKNKKWES